DLSCAHFEDIIDIAAARLAPERALPGPAAVAQAMLRREQEAPSALGEGVAMPHAILPGAPPRAALVTLAQPLSAPTPDGKPLRLIFALVLDQPGNRQLHLLA